MSQKLLPTYFFLNKTSKYKKKLILLILNQTRVQARFFHHVLKVISFKCWEKYVTKKLQIYFSRKRFFDSSCTIYITLIILILKSSQSKLWISSCACNSNWSDSRTANKARRISPDVQPGCDFLYGLICPGILMALRT